MPALIRYQAGMLIRSHRWILPLVGYTVLLAVGGAGSAAQSPGNGLNGGAAILVSAVAVPARSMLTAEPGPARPRVAVTSGPAKAQPATLITALAAGAVLGLAGAGYEVLTSRGQAGLPAGRRGD